VGVGLPFEFCLHVDRPHFWPLCPLSP